MQKSYFCALNFGLNFKLTTQVATNESTKKKIKLSKVDCGIIKINNYVYIYKIR